jgi:hypothetical protein
VRPSGVVVFARVLALVRPSGRCRVGSCSGSGETLRGCRVCSCSGSGETLRGLSWRLCPRHRPVHAAPARLCPVQAQDCNALRPHCRARQVFSQVLVNVLTFASLQATATSRRSLATAVGAAADCGLDGPALGPTQPPVQWVQRNNGRSWKLTTQLHVSTHVLPPPRLTTPLKPCRSVSHRRRVPKGIARQTAS